MLIMKKIMFWGKFNFFGGQAKLSSAQMGKCLQKLTSVPDLAQQPQNDSCRGVDENHSDSVHVILP